MATIITIKPRQEPERPPGKTGRHRSFHDFRNFSSVFIL